MKCVFAWVAVLSLALLCIAGCSGSRRDTADNTGRPGLMVVTTIFPEYSWAKEISGAQGKSIRLDLLTKKGTDMHSYQPGAEDILKISGCDLLVYVGGESDKWIKKALAEQKNPKRRVICLMELLGGRVRAEETVEGMQERKPVSLWNREACNDTNDRRHAGEGKGPHNEEAVSETKTGCGKGAYDAKRGETHDHGNSRAGETEYDEHVWLSLKNADIACRAIADELSAMDPMNAGTYRENYVTYSKKLKALDDRYKEIVAKAPVKTLLFGDRFPFRYLTDDYGLSYYAAFNGCSAETEASFQTIVFLIRKMDELNLPAVLTMEGRQHKLAATIAENTVAKNQKVLTLHSMQSVSEEEIRKGATYLSFMEKNLEVLREALR